MKSLANNFTIANASNVPLNQRAGTVPNMEGALDNWLQPMTFTRVTKETIAFQVVETRVDINFWGVIQPMSYKELQLVPEGQRSWCWLSLVAKCAPNDSILTLDTDEIVTWNGKQTRIMARKHYGLYGFIKYHLVQDWTGSGPPTP